VLETTIHKQIIYL